MGQSPAGLFGYSHMLGGFPGGQAEYLRVPYADVGPIKIPDGLPDEKVVFLSDIFPTGYMAAEKAGIEPGDTVAIWGCGPVAQFAIRSAWMLGAGRVIAIDRVPERLRDGREARQGRDDRFDEAEGLRHADGDDQGPRAGPLHRRASGPRPTPAAASTRCSTRPRRRSAWPPTGRTSLREAIMCCRKGGTVSVPGVYVGFPDKIPFGAAMNKALTFRMGQTHVQRYTEPLLEKIQAGEIDPSFVITHRLPLEEAPGATRRSATRRTTASRSS